MMDQPSLQAALADRYLIERELGHGGMATVYLARDLRHGRAVALKVLRPDLAAVLGADRFLREISLTAQLQHPHILTLIDSGEAAAFLYYVMPYVEGESLRERLQREGQLSVEEVLQVARAVASALDYAHAHGVIHRDIKPENILLHQGEAMVADFGIALAVSAAGRERLTETGLSLGTPAYMSPEQASATPRLDGRSDQYSLACVVYEMLAGEPPYTGPNAQAIIAKRMSEPVPHLRTLRPVSSGLEAAVNRALAKAPADRFPSTGDFVAALNKAPQHQLFAPRKAALLGAAAAFVVVAMLAFLLRPGSERGPMVQRQFTFTGKVTQPVISPDGKRVAYVIGERSLAVQPLAGGEPLVLVPPARFILWPRWTRNGSRLLFCMFRDSTELAATYAVSSMGGPARRVLDDVVPFDTGPDSITLVRAPREKHRLDFADWQTGRTQGGVVLPDSLEDVTRVEWSPDGRFIALAASGKLWTIPAKGGEAHLIGSGWNPRWWSSSAAVYFLSGSPGAVGLKRVTIDRRSGALKEPEQEIASLPRAENFDIAANGNLVYAQTSTSTQVRALTLGGALPRRVIEDRLLTDGTAPVSSASISSDGQSVAYGRTTGGDEDLYLVPFAGGPVRTVAASPSDETQPWWSPLGPRLAFVRVDSASTVVMATDAVGGPTERVGSEPGPGSYLGGIRRPNWSADGRFLGYFSRDLRRVVVADLARQSESVVTIPDSVGTGYSGLILSPTGDEALLSTLRRHTDWGELWLTALDGKRWRKIKGPFGESYPLRWGADGWIYLENHRAQMTDYGVSHQELWRMRGPYGTPQLYAVLPDGCVQADLSRDRSRVVCPSVTQVSDLFLGTNFNAGLR
jgi:eukaryotic-like serine/threonine-protein kinase